MRRACLLAACLALSACAVVKVPVKVAGTAVGGTVLLVTRDAHAPPWR